MTSSDKDPVGKPIPGTYASDEPRRHAEWQRDVDERNAEIDRLTRELGEARKHVEQLELPSIKLEIMKLQPFPESTPVFMFNILEGPVTQDQVDLLQEAVEYKYGLGKKTEPEPERQEDPIYKALPPEDHDFGSEYLERELRAAEKSAAAQERIATALENLTKRGSVLSDIATAIGRIG